MNKIIVIGNVGKVESRDNFTKFGVATSDGWGDNKKTNWHNCIVFKKTKEFVDKYVEKGNKIAVEGSIEYKEHDGKWYTTILVNKVEQLTRKEVNNNNTNNNNNVYNYDENKGNNDDIPF